MRRRRHRRVEEPVALDAVIARLDLGGHVIERRPHRGQILRRAPLGGQFGEFGLQGLARFQYVGQPALAFHEPFDRFGVEAVADEIGAVAVPYLDESLHFEDDDGLLHRRPADAEPPRQFTLGRQPVARPQIDVRHMAAESVEDLFVQSRPGHRPQCVGHTNPHTWSFAA